MTTLAKDEVLRLARECRIDMPDVMYSDDVTFNQLSAFATLCRADLVADVERLKALLDAPSEPFELEVSKWSDAEKDRIARILIKGMRKKTKCERCGISSDSGLSLCAQCNRD
jgi:hypothetical protein